MRVDMYDGSCHVLIARYRRVLIGYGRLPLPQTRGTWLLAFEWLSLDLLNFERHVSSLGDGIKGTRGGNLG